ncbi:hypothetical protein [Porphyromonas cangingivalis]|uniref:hypothetical protein n=1 Tax=Porphyromonas cangingivalis TaxID=36874 RepID=UPI00046F043B|nr:hypothetical protein [Porphyromonas cangingivalis]
MRCPQGIAPPIGGDESSSPLVIYAHPYFVGIIPEQRLFVSYDCYDYLSISIVKTVKSSYVLSDGIGK